MDQKIYGVVTRNWGDHGPVVSTVIDVSGDEVFDGERISNWRENVIKTRAKEHVTGFTDTFIEFRSAKWMLTILKVDPVDTRAVPQLVSHEEVKM
jgi:hypothetical protein